MSPTTGHDSKDTQENKILAAIGYIGILFILPLALKPKNAFCQFHGKQGLVLFIAEVITWAFKFIPLIGKPLWIIGTVATLILAILGILKALKGEYWEMPYIGEYAKKINI